ncbi:hypothetical protein AMTRI_Chr05g71260 [Amborella trichopoda]
MRVLYDLSDFGYIDNGTDDILTPFKHCLRHVSCFTILTSAGDIPTSCPAVFVVPSSYQQPIGNIQPYSILTSNMPIRVYHDGTYGLRCQLVTSVTLARMCLTQ